MRLGCAKRLVMVGHETENETGVCKMDKSVKRQC